MMPRGDRRYRVVVCRGPECGARRNADAVVTAFTDALAAQGLTADLARQSCFGRCSVGPNVLVHEVAMGQPPIAFTRLAIDAGPAALYSRVDPMRVATIVAEHIGAGRVVEAFMEGASAMRSERGLAVIDQPDRSGGPKS